MFLCFYFICLNHQLFPVLHVLLPCYLLSHCFYLFIKIFFWQFPVNHSHTFLPLSLISISQLHLLEAPGLVHEQLSFGLVRWQLDPSGSKLVAVLFILFVFDFFFYLTLPVHLLSEERLYSPTVLTVCYLHIHSVWAVSQWLRCSSCSAN